MRKQGVWSEAPTRLCRQESGSDGSDVQVFEDEEVCTVLESSESMAARAYASAVMPEQGTKRPQLPLPPSLRQVLSASPASAARIPRVATPPARASVPYLTTRVATPKEEITTETRGERRLTLTRLPDANPSSIPVLPLAPISRLAPRAPVRAGRPGSARLRLIGMVTLTGVALGMVAVQVVRVIFS